MLSTLARGATILTFASTATFALIGVNGLTAEAGSIIPLPPYNQCPAIGNSASCGILLVAEPGGTITIYGDTSVGPYDGIEDTLVGILNLSGKPISAITVTGPGSDLSGFDGDGLCTYQSCSWPAPTGYEGPGTTFTTEPALPDAAEVDFTGGLAAGASTYFSLEGYLTSATLTARPGKLKSDFVAMGDSFSAGEGNAPYLMGSDTDLNKCHRSSVAYAPQLSAFHHSHPTPPDFVACSGAITDDLYNPNREGNLILNPATGHYVFEGAQMSELTVDTKLVTLTIGGNDIGFVEVLTKCLVAKGDPDPHCQNTGLAKSISNRIDALSGIGTGYTSTGYLIHPWVSVIKDIHAKAPNARILIGGYPVLVDPDAIKGGDSGYCKVGSMKVIGTPISADVVLHKDEASWIRAKTIAANNGIKQAVIDSHVNEASFVPVASNFAGHALCDGDPWIYQISGEADGFGGTKGRYPWSGSFHPTSMGQMAFESAFAKALG